MKYCFGVDIGGTTVKMGLFTTEGDLLDKWEIKTRTENGGEAILPDIARSLQEKMEEKKITTEVALPGNPTIYGNYSLLYSIFRNLYDNAIAYAGEGIHLTVSCYKEDPKFYYFSFSDNGIGVSEEHVNRIFERFYRVDKGRKLPQRTDLSQERTGQGDDILLHTQEKDLIL